MSYDGVKVTCKVMCSLVKQNVVCFGKMFYSSTMLEFDRDHGIRF